MTLGRHPPGRAVLTGVIALFLVAAAAFAVSRRESNAPFPPNSVAERPQLMLLTALPLIFPEEFILDGGGSKALDALETHYRIVPIGVTDSQSLGRGRLLLMVHPLAQPAEALVDLDRWVRAGGQVLLLADPRLDWRSKRPLGDKLRPPPAFADTGLLAHWGLRLDAPDEMGPAERMIDGVRILLSSPGALSGSCHIVGGGLVARCAIGKGRATVIADADLLQPRGASPQQVEQNLQFVLRELAHLAETIR